MKNAGIYSCLMTLICFRLFPADGGWVAPSTFLGSTVHEQWHACAKAIQTDDFNGFKESFSRDLLPLYAVVVCKENESLTMRPMGLIHFAAHSRGHYASKIIKHLLSAGSDPDFQFSSVYPWTTPDEQKKLIYGLTPLDIAVARGNAPVVEMLLKNNAHPYKTALLLQTSCIKAVLKEVVCCCFGENPLIHACACLEDVQEGAEKSCADKEQCGTKEEYLKIIDLLKQAQTWHNLKQMDRCCSVL